MSTRFFLLPGMGVDSSMYPGPWRELDWVRFLDWPAFRGETTLAEVALRVIEENGIQPGDGVGGSSLGGMVALEIARLVPVSSVVLIGSAMTRSEIHPLLTMAAPLVTLTPLRLAQILAGKSVEGPVGDAFARADPRFVRAMCRALAQWEEAATSSCPVPCIGSTTNAAVEAIASDSAHRYADVINTSEKIRLLETPLSCQTSRSISCGLASSKRDGRALGFNPNFLVGGAGFEPTTPSL